MINVLSYLGMSVQSEVCLWTILGLLRTTFDATLFKVNANLKQVWQMRMPVELSKPVQRGLRTMISGVMLVQCFTVYVYLASYIVLLYPVFLEERPTLVLPWLLLAAVRNLLCELLSLTLGLGTCLLVGPARPPCIKFLIIKIVSIMPAFYMWMLVLSYYNALKLAAAFKTFPAALPANDLDYGLELAIRRRRTKSLFGEALLRTRLITNLYTDKQTAAVEKPAATQENVDVLSETEGQINSRNETDDSNILATDLKSKVEPTDDLRIQSDIDIIGINQTNRLLTLSDLGPFMYEDCFGNEIPVPRNADRINEQFGLMLLRISAYLKKDKSDQFKFLETDSLLPLPHPKDQNLGGPNLTDEPDTPPLVASSKGNMASYLRDYPQIFMKKTSDLQLQQKLDSMRAVQSQIGDNNETTYNDRKQIDFEKTTTTETTISHKKIGKQTETSQRKSLETIDSTLLMQGYNEVTEDVNLNPQNNLTATNSGMNKSSSDSLSSIIARMKTHLSEAKSSKKRNNNNVSSSQTFSSSRTSSKERKQYQKRKID